MSDPETYGRGLRLFPPGTPRGLRRRKLAFAALLAGAAACLVWPVYSWFSGIHPLILGLPLSFAWVILWLLVVFAAQVWIYRSEYGRQGAERRTGRDEGRAGRGDGRVPGSGDVSEAGRPEAGAGAPRGAGG